MKITRLLENLAALPADAQRLANKAMLYTAFAMQNTERQTLNNSGGREVQSVVQSAGVGGVLGQMKSGVVNEQTKKFTQTFKLIMERMDRYQHGGQMRLVEGVDSEGRGFTEVSMGAGSFLTEDAYSDKRASQTRSKTDLRDDFPIELDWQHQRALVNEAYLPGDHKEYFSNIAIERNGGAMVMLEDNLVAAHVKALPGWSRFPKLLEFYTNIQRPMPQFDALQTPEGIRAIAGNISLVMLTQSNHQGDEIFGYRIKDFDKCVVHNGQLVYKFFAEPFI